MFKHIFLLTSILFFSACAERGHKLSINKQTQTVTAQSVSDLKKDKKNTTSDLTRMKNAVQKEQKKSIVKKQKDKKIEDKEIKKVSPIQFKQKPIAKKIKKHNLHTNRRKPLINLNTQQLNFQAIDKTYHKFGTSEIHGHVIYLTQSGQKIKLNESAIYILPVTDSVTRWYENYYLKNKYNALTQSTLVKYINKTHLNLEQNFAFYGIAEGSYYIIIESNYPSSVAKNQKVYVAKKLEVGRYKKVMAVLSKKL
ncbi:MAG: Phage protein [uncultured Sulfurovum sp.]|uniref:Phage protein n=1 Tax=uncultured Sulfurovum sp. TaxID=269237 RepID=A0A6S6UD63_9BACT|nr:MAG: Phage protein [uncultured Sulfurovum sp.]